MYSDIRVDLLLPSSSSLKDAGWRLCLEPPTGLVRFALAMSADDTGTFPSLLVEEGQDFFLLPCGREAGGNPMAVLWLLLPLIFFGGKQTQVIYTYNYNIHTWIIWVKIGNPNNWMVNTKKEVYSDMFLLSRH